jgi:trigger factor
MVLGLSSEVKVKIDSEKDCIKVISVEVASSIVKAKIEEAFENVRSRVKWPGFRPGKAPLDQIKANYKDAAYEKAQEILLQHGVSEALKLKKITAVQPPVIQKIQFDPVKPFQFEFEVEVAPEFKISNYKGLKLTKNTPVVADKDIQKTIDELAQMNSQLVEAQDQEVKNHHHAVINYEGFVDGKEIPGAKAENFLMDLSANQAIQGLADGLVGAKIGEEKSISVKFPEDSPSKDLAGREGSFKVKVVALKEKKLPTIDDEFAKDLGIENLETLKSRVKENLVKEHAAEEDLRKQIVDQLVEANSFPVPPTILKQQVEYLIENQKQRLRQQGVPEADMEKVLERIRPDAHKAAEKEIRVAYIFSSIAQAEKIEVTEEDVDSKVQEILQSTSPQERPALEKAFKGTYRDRVRSDVRELKIFSWLKEHAKIKEN